MYLNQDLVKTSFNRLGPKLSVGKSHLERTSCLMYFFALDAVSLRLKFEVVDFDPSSELGKISRRLMDSEFSRLILFSSSNGIYTQLTGLGKIENLTKSPSMRIASNFYSVPLKNAASSSGEYSYPRRPDKPILSMGKSSTGHVWGVKKHQSWKTNLPVMFQHSSSPTPFTDIAIYVLRNHRFSEYGGEYYEVFENALLSKFSPELVEYWMNKLSSEKVYCAHIRDVFTKTNEKSKIASAFTDDVRKDSLSALQDRIKYLEQVLNKNGINF